MCSDRVNYLTDLGCCHLEGTPPGSSGNRLRENLNFGGKALLTDVRCKNRKLCKTIINFNCHIWAGKWVEKNYSTFRLSDSVTRFRLGFAFPARLFDSDCDLSAIFGLGFGGVLAAFSATALFLDLASLRHSDSYSEFESKTDV